MHLLSLATALASILGCIGVDYSDIEALGAACKGRDSCANLAHPDDFFERNCECDDRCDIFGDCCVDVSGVKRYRNHMLRCMPYGTQQNLGAYVIGECPQRGVSANADCLRNDPSDPMASAPVSSPRGPTYRNVRCAACHGADLSDLELWSPIVFCESLAPHNLSDAFVWEHIESAPDNDEEWGLQFLGQFHKCELRYSKPDSVRNVRPCRADVVSTCSENWKRAKVRRQCRAYTAVVYTVDHVYRNPHCALCNDVTIERMVCDHKELLHRRFKNFTLGHLFDVNRSDGDLVGISQPGSCPKGQQYDPYFKKCRNLVCGVPGYKMVGNKCQKI